MTASFLGATLTPFCERRPPRHARRWLAVTSPGGRMPVLLRLRSRSSSPRSNAPDGLRLPDPAPFGHHRVDIQLGEAGRGTLGDSRIGPGDLGVQSTAAPSNCPSLATPPDPPDFGLDLP